MKHLGISFLVLLILAAPFGGNLGRAETPAPFSEPLVDSAFPDLESWIDELSALLEGSQYPEVITRGKELVHQVRRARPEGSLAEARLLDMVVSAAYRSRHVMDEDILEDAKRAVALKEAAVGPESNGFSTSLVNLATLHSYRWEGELAVPLFERAAAILKSLGPESDELRAKVLSSQGVACRRIGEPARAMELYREALEIQTRILGPDHPDVGSSLHNMGLIYNHFGDYQQAGRVYRRALAIREAAFGPDSEWVAETCNNLSTVCGYLGEYEESIAQQERAVKIWAEGLGMEHPRYWTGRQNLALCYLDMGDHQGALPHLLEVVEALGRIYGPDHVNMTYPLDALGSCYRRLGDPAKGLEYYLRSLKIGEAAYGPEHDYNSATMMDIGRCQIELGQLEDAAETLHRSLAIREKALPVGSLELCELLHRMADVHLQLGEPEEALRFADRSLENLRVFGENAHPLIAEGLLMRARALAAMGQQDLALDGSLAADDVSRRHLYDTMPALSENRALDYASTRIVGQDLAVSLLRDGEAGARVERVWNTVTRSRSAVLDEYCARNSMLRGHADPFVTVLVDSSLILRERIANLSLRGPGWEDDRSFLESLAKARAGLDQIERRLSKAGADNDRSRWEREIGIEQVRSNLAPGQALVAYLRFEDQAAGDAADRTLRYRAFVLAGPEAEPVIVDLGEATEIEDRIAAWRTQVAGGGFSAGTKAGEESPLASARGFVRLPQAADKRLDSYRTVASDLRERIWDPLSGLVANADRVFLVLDGDLHLVNFNALPVGTDGFLVEQAQELHLLINERSLARTRDGFRPGRGVFALGDPDFSGPGTGSNPADARPVARTGLSPCPEAGPLEFEPLPGARLEVELVSRLWRKYRDDGTAASRILVGEEATERTLKSEFNDAGTIHLATHGFFLANSCSGTGIGDSRWRNPLVLSGLALAGANLWGSAEPGQEDGILTAEEVAALDLSGVEWAVLSACDTGLGAEGARGEGVFGLQRAFTLAGARTVIMSLWSVRDDAAREWMEALYQARWIENRDTACSVRGATLAILNARRQDGLSLHPYFWAGFTAAGDWR